MKNSIFACFLLLGTVALFSCNRTHEEYNMWGQTKHYKPFLWEKHAPDTLKKYLKYEFNEDAAELTEPIVFSLYMVPEEEGKECFKADPNDVELYVDGALQPNNTFSLKPVSGEHEVEFGIVLTQKLLEAEDYDRDYQIVFKVEKNQGIDRINDFKIGNLKEKQMVLEPQKDDKTPIRIRVEYVANMLKVGVMSTLSVLLALLVAFIVIVQVFTKRFNRLQLSKVFVTIDENRKNITRMKASLQSSKEIVLTPKEQKQSFLKMLFTGKVSYIVIKGLPSEVRLTPGIKSQTNVVYKRNDYMMTMAGDNDELRILKNVNTEQGHKIEIEYRAIR